MFLRISLRIHRQVLRLYVSVFAPAESRLSPPHPTSALDGPRLSGVSPATNAPAEAETPLSCKHRGQDTTSVTGATPADRYPLYVSGQKAKPLAGCGG